MDAQRNGFARREAVPIGAQALVVDAVAGFVQRAEKAPGKMMFVVACGDAAIVRSLGGTKGMGRWVEPAAVEIETDVLTHVEGKTFLGIDGILPGDDFDFW